MAQLLPKETLSSIRVWTWHHAVVFFITYVAMLFLHGCRKSFSDVKFSMAKSMSPANGTLFPHNVWKSENMFEDSSSANIFFGELDLLCLLAYAIGLYASGVIGDRVNLVYLFTAGMCLAAVTLLLFGYLSVVWKIRNHTYFYVVYFINGLFQSTGMPTSVAIMGNWFSKSSGGLAFGVWSTHMNVGHIIGSCVIAALLDYGYEYGMLLNSVLLFYSGVVVFVCLIPDPDQIGLPGVNGCDGHEGCDGNEDLDTLHETDDVTAKLLPSPQEEEKIPDEKCEDEPSSKDENNEIKEKQECLPECTDCTPRKAINFMEAFAVPNVISYAISLFFLNMVTSGLLLWLPVYLSESLHLTGKESVWLSNMFDVGFIVGSIMCGVLSDIAGVRSPVLFIMLLISTGFIYLFNVIPATDFTSTGVVMVMTGILTGGPANIIHTSVCADLGKHKDVVDANTEATATMTGIIDGTGNLGAALGQLFIGVLSEYGGWTWVFNFLLVMLGMSVICLLPLVVGDVRYVRGCRSDYKAYDTLPDDEDTSCALPNKPGSD